MVAIHSSDLHDNEGWQTQFSSLKDSKIGSHERLYWMMNTRDVVEKHYLNKSDLELLLELAFRLCDWAMVISLSKELLAEPKLSDSQRISIAMDLAEAHLQRGIPGLAKNALTRLLFEHYQHADLFSFYRFVQQKHKKQKQQTYPARDCVNGELLLTPLEQHHIDSFRWIYSQEPSGERKKSSAEKQKNDWRQQSVAQLCNLPRFKNDKHWKNWLHRHQNEQDCHLFAVVHSEWGLIGSVSLEMFDGVGFFYYWLGEDFQGMGFGPKAVKILLSLGQNYLSMQCCYAKVYDYNQPSQKALKKIGFQKLPFKVKPPRDNEWLYYFGRSKMILENRSEVDKLLKNMDSDIELI